MLVQMISQRKSGVILGYVNILVKNLVNLIYTPMLLSFVGQADYGVYQTSNSLIFSLSLLSFGFSEAYVRFYVQRKTHGTDEDILRLNGMYLLLYIVVSILALLLGLLFSWNAGVVFAGSFTQDQINLVRVLMAIMSASVALTLFSTVFDAYILAHEQFRFQQSRQILTTLATPVFAYLFLRMGMGAAGVAIAQLLVQIVLLFLNACYAIKNLSMRFDFRHFDKALFLAIASFSAWIFVNQVCDLVNQSVPNILLGALTSATAVSVFAVAVNIRQVFYSLSTTISNVFVPKINQIVAESDDNEVLTHLMTNVGRYQMVLFCWVYGGFVLLGRYFISVWAGEGFSDAYWLVLAMTLPVMVPLCQNTGIEIQRAKNKHKARSIVYLCMAGLNVVFTIVASPIIGYWAPAIAYILSIALGNGVFMNWYYQKHIGLDMLYFWRRNVPIIISTAMVTSLCCLGSSVLPVNGIVSFIGWGLLYSAIFLASLWLFVLDQDEKKAFVGKLPFLR